MVGRLIDSSSPITLAPPAGLIVLPEATDPASARGSASSPDSAPIGLARHRHPLTAPALLVSFSIAVVLAEPRFPQVLYLYERLVSAVSGVPRSALTTHATIAIRPLLAILVVSWAAFAAGRVWERLTAGALMVGAIAAASTITDVLVAWWHTRGGPSPFSTTGNAVVAIVDVLVAGVVVMRRIALPPPVRVRTYVSRSWKPTLRLVDAAALSGVAALLVTRHWTLPAHLFDDTPLLGGASSTILVSLSFLYVALFATGWRASTSKAGSSSPPSIAFVIPARNEARSIERCVEAIDLAAANAAARCAVYVVENGSSDGTPWLARRALERCVSVTPHFLEAEPLGKARALNIGLTNATEDIVVRVDADTVIGRDAIGILARHFADPQVGGLSGMPLPESRRSWIERMRAIEVYYNVGYKRVAQGALDAITVLPGAIVAYRREILLRLEGFAEGMNGEDADITVRVGRLGFRVVSDVRLRASTATPPDLRALRDQRIRWARGFYHMFGRNYGTILSGQGYRGLLLLPWAFFNNFHKLVVTPLAAAAILVSLVSRSPSPWHEIAPAAAIFLGFQLLQMAIALLSARQYELLASLPSFLVFRLIVAYFAIETLLTLNLRPLRASAR